MREALRGFEVREEGGLFATGWSPERTAGESGFLMGNDYRVRVRHAVSLEGGEVAVRSDVERRPPGGPRANRWQRVDPRREEERLLAAIAERLGDTP